MDRADRRGLGLAAGAHVALLALLSLGIVARPKPVKPPEQVMDVQLTDKVGLTSAAPTPATEAPAPSEAPELAPEAEAPPAEAAPPPPAPQPEPKPAPTPQPKPAPEPKPAKPVPPEPAPKPTPVVKPAAPAKSATKAEPRPRLSSDILKGLKDPAAREAKAGGSRLGPNFLKGLAGATAGKATSARAQVSGAAMNGLAAAIRRQVQPCYELGGLGGTPAMRIVTVLRLRFNKDGSVAGTPQVVEQTGVDEANQAYARQMADVSRRAVLRCAPLKLPPDLYEGGWELIDMGFIPGQLS